MADETSEPTPKKSRRDKEVLPFSEDAEELDGRAWYQRPLIVLGVVLLVVAVVVAIVLAGKDLTSDSDDGGGGTVPPPIQTTTTTTSTTSTTSSTTTSTSAPPPTTVPGGLQPGDPCSPEEGNPDCIDPEGDGRYHLIIGGGECLETADDSLECADNDGDGDAGPAVTPT
jgi:hypothetical protein